MGILSLQQGRHVSVSPHRSVSVFSIYAGSDATKLDLAPAAPFSLGLRARPGSRSAQLIWAFRSSTSDSQQVDRQSRPKLVPPYTNVRSAPSSASIDGLGGLCLLLPEGGEGVVRWPKTQARHLWQWRPYTRRAPLAHRACAPYTNAAPARLFCRFCELLQACLPDRLPERPGPQ